MAKATRNRALVVVRESLAHATRERDQLNASIDVLMKLEQSLAEAYSRKPKGTTRGKVAARAVVKKTWDSATTNATKIDLAANAKARRLELDEANPDTSKM